MSDAAYSLAVERLSVEDGGGFTVYALVLPARAFTVTGEDRRKVSP